MASCSSKIEYEVTRTKQKSKKCSSETSENNVYFDIRGDQLPIIYSSAYDIRFLGMEKLHPFDSRKWGRVFSYLVDANIITRESSVQPREAKEEDLLVVHSNAYLKKLKWSYHVAGVTEMPFLAAIPNALVQRYVLRPFRYQTGGSILAGKLAVERGWAINIGGGFHHCSKDKGGGFCAYADITLCIKFLFKHCSTVSKAMIIDLDAHQGNGHERDFMNDKTVYILDIFNGYIYPLDDYAKNAADRCVELRHMVEDEDYLSKVSQCIEVAMNEFDADVLIYNAGTDILQGDPLGNFAVSAQGIIARDELVFTAARSRGIPIVMLTSGGYQKSTARIIADSIINLFEKKIIQ